MIELKRSFDVSKNFFYKNKEVKKKVEKERKREKKRKKVLIHY